MGEEWLVFLPVIQSEPKASVGICWFYMDDKLDDIGFMSGSFALLRMTGGGRQLLSFE